jgi:predicted nucleotidyltransferase
MVDAWASRRAARVGAARRAARQEARDAIHALADAHGLRRVVLFGSVAAGDFDPDRSDVDLLVEGPPGLDVGALCGDLLARVGRMVHVVDAAHAPESLVRAALARGEVLLDRT